jgi:hypothetical protein
VSRFDTVVTHPRSSASIFLCALLLASSALKVPSWLVLTGWWAEAMVCCGDDCRCEERTKLPCGCNKPVKTPTGDMPSISSLFPCGCTHHDPRMAPMHREPLLEAPTATTACDFEFAHPLFLSAANAPISAILEPDVPPPRNSL